MKFKLKAQDTQGHAIQREKEWGKGGVLWYHAIKERQWWIRTDEECSSGEEAMIKQGGEAEAKKEEEEKKKKKGTTSSGTGEYNLAPVSLHPITPRAKKKKKNL